MLRTVLYRCTFIIIYMYIIFLQRGWTPLGIAADRGHTDTCELLLAAGADVHKEAQVSVQFTYVYTSLFIEYLKLNAYIRIYYSDLLSHNNSV